MSSFPMSYFSMSSLQRVAIALAVVGTAVTASAQTVTTTTTTVERAGPPMRLSPQQRTVIYRTVTTERRVAPEMRVQQTPLDVTIGRPVPPSIALSPFPETVYVETPALRQYRYFQVGDRLVLVDPATSEVVDILDR